MIKERDDEHEETKMYGFNGFVSSDPDDLGMLQRR